MTRARRLQLQGALVVLLGSVAVVSSPKRAVAAVLDGCYPSCIDGVWDLRCPIGAYAACDYFACEPQVYVYCAWDS
jgi:hypothetical protein